MPKTGKVLAFQEKPGLSQKEVASHFKLSPSSVHWHVERLSEVQLVSKVRESHSVKYLPGEGWDHLTIEDLNAIEKAPRAAPPGATTVRLTTAADEVASGRPAGPAAGT